MSTVTGNLYVVDELCITEVEWAPYKFYLRPLDDDLVNSKGSHSPPPPISYLYTKSQPGSAVEALLTNFSAPVDRANLHLKCKAQLFLTSVASTVHHYTHPCALKTKFTIALTS